jgi:hypothetical protein
VSFERLLTRPDQGAAEPQPHRGGGRNSAWVKERSIRTSKLPPSRASARRAGRRSSDAGILIAVPVLSNARDRPGSARRRPPRAPSGIILRSIFTVGLARERNALAGPASVRPRLVPGEDDGPQDPGLIGVGRCRRAHDWLKGSAGPIPCLIRAREGDAAFDGTTHRSRPMKTFHHDREPSGVRMLCLATTQMPGGAHNRRKPRGSWGSSRRDCAPGQGRRALQSPLYRLLRRLESHEPMSNHASKSPGPSGHLREAVHAVARGAWRTFLHPARSGSDGIPSSKGPLVLADHAPWRPCTESRRYPRASGDHHAGDAPCAGVSIQCP